MLSSKTSCSLDTKLPQLEDRDREQNEAHTVHEEIGGLLYNLDIHKSMGPDGVHPRVMRELVKMHTKTLSIIYQPWLTKEVLVNWRMAIYKGQKEDLGNCQSDLSAREDREADHLKCHVHVHMQGNQVVRTQSAWVYEEQVLLDNPNVLLCQNDPFSG